MSEIDEVDVLTPPRGMRKNACFVKSKHGDGTELERICRKERNRREQILRANKRRRIEWMRRKRQNAARYRDSLLAEPLWVPDWTDPELEEERITIVFLDNEILDEEYDLSYYDELKRKYEEWLGEKSPLHYELCRQDEAERYDDETWLWDDDNDDLYCLQEATEGLDEYDEDDN